MTKHIASVHEGDPVEATGSANYFSTEAKTIEDHGTNKMAMADKNVSLKAQFTCYVCQRPFKRKDNIKSHLWTSHREGEEINKKFPCNFCDGKFDRKSILLTHIKGVHTRLKDQSCPKCGFVTAYKQDLKRHMIQHRKK